MGTDEFLLKLSSSRRSGLGYLARCPAHTDKSPSLSIREANGKTLLHCFGGCHPEEIVAAIGLEMRDLFTDTPTSHGQRPTLKPRKLDLIDLGFQFELGALDRRLRADTVLQAVADCKTADLSEEDRDRLMNVVAHAYDDKDRAEFLESVADDFRLKAFHERTEHHAA